VSDLIALGIKLALVAAAAAAIAAAWHFYVAEPYRAQGKAEQIKVMQPQIDKANARAQAAEDDAATSKRNVDTLREAVDQQDAQIKALLAQAQAKMKELDAVRAMLAAERVKVQAQIDNLQKVINGPKATDHVLEKTDGILRDALADRLRG
jgi:flagellar motility protein MotE (MotC chaperone)